MNLPIFFVKLVLLLKNYPKILSSSVLVIVLLHKKITKKNLIYCTGHELQRVFLPNKGNSYHYTSLSYKINNLFIYSHLSSSRVDNKYHNMTQSYLFHWQGFINKLRQVCLTFSYMFCTSINSNASIIS